MRTNACITLVCILLSFSNSHAQKFGTGQNVEWISNAELRVPLSAAFGRSGLPVVAYNSEMMANFPQSFALFLLARQDYVAALATDSLAGEREGSRSGGRKLQSLSGTRQLPSDLIDERLIYDHPIFRNSNPAQAIDCLAFQSIPPQQRQQLLEVVLLYPNTEIRIFPTSRLLQLADIQFGLNSQACISFTQSFRRK